MSYNLLADELLIHALVNCNSVGTRAAFFNGLEDVEMAALHSAASKSTGRPQGGRADSAPAASDARSKKNPSNVVIDLTAGDLSDTLQDPQSSAQKKRRKSESQHKSKAAKNSAPPGETPEPLPPSALLVANTHVLFNTKRGDIKLGQLRVTLSRMAALCQAAAKSAAENGGADLQVHPIFCGDFNATPGSGLYNYVTEGGLELAEWDRRCLSGQIKGLGYSHYLDDLFQGGAAQWGVPSHPIKAASSLTPPASSCYAAGCAMFITITLLFTAPLHFTPFQARLKAPGQIEGTGYSHYQDHLYQGGQPKVGYIHTPAQPAPPPRAPVPSQQPFDSPYDVWGRPPASVVNSWGQTSAGAHRGSGRPQFGRSRSAPSSYFWNQEELEYALGKQLHISEARSEADDGSEGG
eukprot:gene12771-16025_t